MEALVPVVLRDDVGAVSGHYCGPVHTSKVEVLIGEEHALLLKDTAGLALVLAAVADVLNERRILDHLVTLVLVGPGGDARPIAGADDDVSRECSHHSVTSIQYPV